MRTPLRMRMPFSFFLGESLMGVAFCCFFWTLSCFLTTSSFSPAQCMLLSFRFLAIAVHDVR